MKPSVYIDNSIGRRGRVVVAALDEAGKEVDHEIVLKHPMLLRLRVRLAWRRVRVRARKLAKVSARLKELFG